MFAPEAAWLLGVSSIDVMERAGSFSLKMGALALPRDATKPLVPSAGGRLHPWAMRAIG